MAKPLLHWAGLHGLPGDDYVHLGVLYKSIAVVFYWESQTCQSGL